MRLMHLTSEISMKTTPKESRFVRIDRKINANICFSRHPVDRSRSRTLQELSYSHIRTLATRNHRWLSFDQRFVRTFNCNSDFWSSFQKPFSTLSIKKQTRSNRNDVLNSSKTIFTMTKRLQIWFSKVNWRKTLEPSDFLGRFVIRNYIQTDWNYTTKKETRILKWGTDRKFFFDEKEEKIVVDHDRRSIFALKNRNLHWNYFSRLSKGLHNGKNRTHRLERMQRTKDNNYSSERWQWTTIDVITAGKAFNSVCHCS